MQPRYAALCSLIGMSERRRSVAVCSSVEKTKPLFMSLVHVHASRNSSPSSRYRLNELRNCPRVRSTKHVLSASLAAGA